MFVIAFSQAAKHKYEVLCREGADINRRIKEQADATRLAEASALLCLVFIILCIVLPCWILSSRVVFRLAVF